MDDTQSVNAIVEFTDDVSASLPDHFVVEFLDPAGNNVGVKYDLINDPPLHNTTTPALLQGSAFSDTTLSAAASRNQALLGIALALAFTIVGIIRIEMYHRHLLSPPVQEEDAEWRVEPGR